jgi:plastocyanin
MGKLTALIVGAACLMAAGATNALAEGGPQRVAQIVALDECDPATFNGALGVGGVPFCLNVALAAITDGNGKPLYTTNLNDLFAEATGPGIGDPAWDFEPDKVVIKKGTVLDVVDQGGEPHTFTEVKQFGGGFIDGLNGGEDQAPECQGGFKNLGVARTRILQGSHLLITDLSKGTHFFECCIHPWMRMEVDVK